MSSMKNFMSVYGLALASVMAEGAKWDATQEKRKVKKEETQEERERRLKESQSKIHKSNGLKEFHYKEGSIWALSQKRADKKAKNKGWIN